MRGTVRVESNWVWEQFSERPYNLPIIRLFTCTWVIWRAKRRLRKQPSSGFGMAVLNDALFRNIRARRRGESVAVQRMAPQPIGMTKLGDG